jgi:hypothetical protein
VSLFTQEPHSMARPGANQWKINLALVLLLTHAAAHDGSEDEVGDKSNHSSDVCCHREKQIVRIQKRCNCE